MPLPDDFKDSMEILGEEEYKRLLEDVGRFNKVKIDMINRVSHFASFDEFAAWFKASSHQQLNKKIDWIKEFLAK